MPRLKYVGPSDAVDIPALGLVAIKRGEAFDADGSEKSLLKQDAFMPAAAAKSPAKEK
jgi:hypothetical protein